ncbi:putative membrane protein YdfK [bacterium HR16]|nr:putative membrane protein YdfK [bacterium HR16]
MIGTFINTAAVVVGTGVGLTARRFLKPRLRETTMQIIGLMTLMIGVQMSLSEKNPLLPLASLLLGAIIGEGLDIEAKLDALGNALQQRFSNEGGSTFSQAFVSTSILFCVGPMTIMGCIQDGLTGNYSLLLVKSLLDGVSSAFFTAALGWGVLFSAGTVLVVQGTLTLGAGWIGNVLTEGMKNVMFATGGLMMLGLGIRLLNLRPIPVANFLPALLIAPLLVWLMNLWR